MSRAGGERSGGAPAAERSAPTSRLAVSARMYSVAQGRSSQSDHQNAVARSLEIIGEAAGRVSRTLQDAHPEIPWRAIVGMRNRLIHGYADVRLDVVWSVADIQLEALISALQPMIPDEADGAD